MSISGRRFLVCLVWSAVGVMLILRGLPYAGFCEGVDVAHLEGSERWIAIGAAVLVGCGKGFTVLKKSARRIVGNIIQRGESAPPWSVFGLPMILLIGLMVGGGMALRLAPYDENLKAWIIAILYPGIGLALIIGGLLTLTAEPLDT